jgi:hypothetical protein
VLFGLPEEVACEVLGQLQPHDVARLESAFVNSNTIGKLYGLLAKVCIQNDRRFLWNKVELAWLGKRPLRLSCLTLRAQPHELIDCLGRQGRLNVKRIAFRGTFRAPAENLLKISEMCSMLESLTLVSFLPFSTEMMTEIALNLPTLRHFAFTVSTNLTPGPLAAITKHCTLLEHLQVSGDIMSAAAVAMWAPHCKALKILEFWSYGQVRESIPLIAQYCSNLESLLFNSLGSDTQDAQLVTLLDSCPRLNALNISFQRHLTLEAITALSSGRHRWRELRVDTFPLKHEQAEKLFAHSPALEVVSLSHCEALEGSVVDALSANCPNLTHLYLARCGAVTESSLCLMAQRLCHLRELNLRDTNTADAVLIEISHNCTQLEVLNLLDCGQFSSAAFAQLATACRGLRDVNLQSCAQLTDEAVTALSRCLWLEKVDLTDLLLLTDACVMSLSKRCTHLREIHLVGCMEITTAVVASLETWCKKLVVLQVGPRMGRSHNALGWCSHWM